MEGIATSFLLTTIHLFAMWGGVRKRKDGSGCVCPFTGWRDGKEKLAMPPLVFLPWEGESVTMLPLLLLLWWMGEGWEGKLSLLPSAVTTHNLTTQMSPVPHG